MSKSIEILSPEHIDKIDSILDKFETEKVGLPKLSKIEAPEYLYMDLKTLNSKNVEQLNNAMFTLNQYGLYLKRVINKNKAWRRWCLSKINEIASHNIPKLDKNLGYNERELIAKHEPEICKRIHKYLREINMELDRLEDLPTFIKSLSDSIREIKFYKIQKEKVNG